VPKGSQYFPASIASVQGEQAFIGALRRREPEAERQVVRQLREDLRNGGGQARGLSLLQHAFRSAIVGWLQHKWFKGDVRTAEEAWNDTLYRVWTRLEQYDENRSRFPTWVWNQARYAALDLLRKPETGRDIPYAREERADDAKEQEALDPLARGLEEEAKRQFDEPEPLTRMEERAIRQALRRLSNTEQWLLRLRYVHGFRNVDIARQELAGRPLPEEHVRVYVNRAAERLRTYYEQELRSQAAEGR
jgi:RNA polymerase sigma factor (sigma-70 family)